MFSKQSDSITSRNNVSLSKERGESWNMIHTTHQCMCQPHRCTHHTPVHVAASCEWNLVLVVPTAFWVPSREGCRTRLETWMWATMISPWTTAIAGSLCRQQLTPCSFALSLGFTWDSSLEHWLSGNTYSLHLLSSTQKSALTWYLTISSTLNYRMWVLCKHVRFFWMSSGPLFVSHVCTCVCHIDQ